ncbi:MAG: hypothetical protein KKG60_00090 [Nanoarchaeota archaeon]|nr:hypothetical protein [Nanoarchaeota archaeon]
MVEKIWVGTLENKIQGLNTIKSDLKLGIEKERNILKDWYSQLGKEDGYIGEVIKGGATFYEDMFLDIKRRYNSLFRKIFPGTDRGIDRGLDRGIHELSKSLTKVVDIDTDNYNLLKTSEVRKSNKSSLKWGLFGLGLLTALNVPDSGLPKETKEILEYGKNMMIGFFGGAIVSRFIYYNRFKGVWNNCERNTKKADKILKRNLDDPYLKEP